MIWLRNWAFMLVFYTISVPIVVTVPISALFGSRAVIVHSTIWTRFHRWCARVILGVHIRVEGTRRVNANVVKRMFKFAKKTQERLNAARHAGAIDY